MRKIDYLLIVVIFVLLPIAVISFPQKETNFLTPSKEIISLEPKSQDIKVNLVTENNTITLSLDDYLFGVVSAEMPASFNLEALKAQATAARTYTLAKYQKNKPITIRLTEQAYKTTAELKILWQDNYDKYANKIKEALSETNNNVILYDNELIHAYYYAMSNGYTENVATVFQEELPYLNSVSSTWDETQNNFEVTKSMSYIDFLKLLELPNEELSITNIKRNNSNRVDSITINNKTFTGIEIRTKLNLRSTDFTIIKEGDTINITTKGYGHGVGMSQYGANALANSGKNYQEILTYYYQNTEIKNYEV